MVQLDDLELFRLSLNDADEDGSKYESGAGNVSSLKLGLGRIAGFFQRGSSSSDETGCVVLCTIFCK